MPPIDPGEGACVCVCVPDPNSVGGIWQEKDTYLINQWKGRQVQEGDNDVDDDEDDQMKLETCQ